LVFALIRDTNVLRYAIVADEQFLEGGDTESKGDMPTFADSFDYESDSDLEDESLQKTEIEPAEDSENSHVDRLGMAILR
jgi:hypothetical protein